MLSQSHKLHLVKNKFKEILSSGITDSPRVLTTTNWSSFIKLSNDRLNILSVNDLLPKSQFYEIDRSFELRNIFVPILTLGFEKEFVRVIQLFSDKGIAQKFELKPGYFKDMVLSWDIERDPAKQTYPQQVKRWEDPLTYIKHKNECVLCDFSRDFSDIFTKKNIYVNILKKDYSEYIHRESHVDKTLINMKESGLFESQKSKYLKILSIIKDSNKVIATEDWTSFMRRETQFKIILINNFKNESNYAYLIFNVFVPIIAFGLDSELGRVVNLLKEIGLANKFELKLGYFKYLVKEMDVVSKRFTDPVCFYYSDRTARFNFSEGTSLTVLIKDYDKYFFRRKDAEKSLWGVQKYTCQYCGRVAEHIDHIMPLSKGGGCEHDNLALSCQICNLRKKGNTPDEARMPLVRDFPEIDTKWAVSSDQYFKPDIMFAREVSIRPHPDKKYYKITLMDKMTREIICEYIAETKSEAFWKFIELYESEHPTYTFNPFGRVDSARRDVRDLSLQAEDEELKANLAPLKTKLIKYLKKPSQTFPVLDVYAALIQEIAFSEKLDLEVFRCSICKKSKIFLADATFLFYINSVEEHINPLTTVICAHCAAGFIERKKVSMGKYWADIVIGNKWHTLESFAKKHIGTLRANYISHIGYLLSEADKEDVRAIDLEKLAEYICLHDLCSSQGFKVSPWRSQWGFSLVEFVNALPETPEGHP